MVVVASVVMGFLAIVVVVMMVVVVVVVAVVVVVVVIVVVHGGGSSLCEWMSIIASCVACVHAGFVKLCPAACCRQRQSAAQSFRLGGGVDLWGGSCAGKRVLGVCVGVRVGP